MNQPCAVSPPVFRSSARRRRGVELVEFALVLPLACVMLFSTMEFSWYMFQRGGVMDAARLGCRAAAQVNPAMDDVAGVAVARVQAELTLAGLECDSDCSILITDLSDAPLPRVVCEVRLPYRPLTGMLGQSDSSGSLSGLSTGSSTWNGVGVLPDTLHGLSTAAFEGM